MLLCERTNIDVSSVTHFEVHLALDSAVVLALRLVEYHPDPLAGRESRIADVSDDALALLHGHLDPLADFVRHLRPAEICQSRLRAPNVHISCTRLTSSLVAFDSPRTDSFPAPTSPAVRHRSRSTRNLGPYIRMPACLPEKLPTSAPRRLLLSDCTSSIIAPSIALGERTG